MAVMTIHALSFHSRLMTALCCVGRVLIVAFKADLFRGDFKHIFVVTGMHCMAACAVIAAVRFMNVSIRIIRFVMTFKAERIRLVLQCYFS